MSRLSENATSIEIIDARAQKRVLQRKFISANKVKY
jgi:hypothetical protein